MEPKPHLSHLPSIPPDACCPLCQHPEMKADLYWNHIADLDMTARALIQHMSIHMGKEDCFVFPLILDMSFGPDRDMEVMMRQNMFLN